MPSPATERVPAPLDATAPRKATGPLAAARERLIRWRRRLTLLTIAAALAAAAAFVLDANPLPDVTSVAPPSWLPLRFADSSCTAAWLTRREVSPEDPKYDGDGGRESHCVSEPLQLAAEPYLVLQYAGDPSDPKIHVGLDSNGDGQAELPLTLGNAAYRRFLVAFAPLPAPTPTAPVRLVIDDASTRPLGWLAVRALGQSRSALFERRAPPFRSAFAHILLTVVAVALALFYARFVSLRAAAPFVAGACVFTFLQMHTFYWWDDYSLLLRYYDAVDVAELLSCNGHPGPLFYASFAGIVHLAGEHMEWVQLGLLASHLVVVALLWAVLRRHGFSPLSSTGLTTLYALSWVHIEVVPWLVTLTFPLTAALILLTLRESMRYVEGNARALAWASLFAAIACVTYTTGLVAPWVGALYIVLFGKRRRVRALVVLALVGLLGVAAAFALRAAGAEVPLPQTWTWARLGGAFVYLGRGIVQGSLLSLIAYRHKLNTGWVFVGLLGLGLVLLALYRRRVASSVWRGLLFGGGWLVASYLMQAVVRSEEFGTHQALSFRYTYLGMHGAVFFLGALLAGLLGLLQRHEPAAKAPSPTRAPWLGPALALLGALAVVILAGVDARQYLRRADEHERQHHEANHQLYVLTHAALAASHRDGKPLVDGPVPYNLHPYITRRQFAAMAVFLSGGAAADTTTHTWVADRPLHRDDGWQVLLVEPAGTNGPESLDAPN